MVVSIFSNLDINNVYPKMESRIKWHIIVIRSFLKMISIWTMILFVIFLLLNYYLFEKGFIIEFSLLEIILFMLFNFFFTTLMMTLWRLHKVLFLWTIYLIFSAILIMFLYFLPYILKLFPDFILSILGYQETNADSALYMLSALIQSEAAIIAIVVTLSMVAIQHSASIYSPKLIDIFRKKPDLWLLMLIYTGAILYGLIVLKKIDAEFDSNIILPSLEYHILRLYFLAIIAFIALIIYLRNILKLLQPSSIIWWISEEITPQVIEESMNVKFFDMNNSIQQLIDIAYSSIVRHDLNTSNYAISTLYFRLNESIDSKFFDDEEVEKIQLGYLSCLTKIGLFSVVNRDDSFTNVLLVYITKIGEKAILQNNKKIMKSVINSFHNIGNEAFNQNVEQPIFMILNRFVDFEIKADTNRIDILRVIKRYTIKAINHNMVSLVEYGALHLANIREYGIDKKIEDITEFSNKSFEIILKMAKEKDLINLSEIETTYKEFEGYTNQPLEEN